MVRWSPIRHASRLGQHFCGRALLQWVFRALPFGRRDDTPEANLDPPEANLDQPEDNLSDQPEVPPRNLRRIPQRNLRFLRGTGGFIRPTNNSTDLT